MSTLGAAELLFEPRKSLVSLRPAENVRWRPGLCRSRRISAGAGQRSSIAVTGAEKLEMDEGAALELHAADLNIARGGPARQRPPRFPGPSRSASTLRIGLCPDWSAAARYDIRVLCQEKRFGGEGVLGRLLVAADVHEDGGRRRSHRLRASCRRSSTCVRNEMRSSFGCFRFRSI